MSLQDEITLTLRSFQKFSDFLAATGAIISNLLLIFVICMTYVNKIKGKNILMTSMYSYDILNNLQEFYSHSKRKEDANKDEEIKGKIEVGNNEIKNNDKPFRESKEKDQSIVMINIKDQVKEKKKDSKLESFF